MYYCWFRRCGLVSALRAGFRAAARAYFLLLRQKKVAKEKATPALRGQLRWLPCATRQAGRLRNSGLCPSDSPRRLPPARLRCSALHEGEGKAHRTESKRLAVDVRLVFILPVASSSSARRNGKKGEDCLRGAAPSSAAPVAAEQRRDPGVAGRRCGRAFFLGTSSWQDKKKYLAGRRNTALQKTPQPDLTKRRGKRRMDTKLA